MDQADELNSLLKAARSKIDINPSAENRVQMKTTISMEYDYEDRDARHLVERMQNADEAWSSLYKIQEMIHKYREREDTSVASVEMLDQIQGEINETRLEKVFGHDEMQIVQ